MEPEKYSAGFDEEGYMPELDKRQTEKGKKIKNILIYAATTLMIALTVVSFAVNGLGKRTLFGGTISDDYNEGSNLINQELLMEEVKDSLNTYFEQTRLVDCISDSDLEELTALISAGVFNSLPEDTLTESEKNDVRLLISSSVVDVVTDLNSQLSEEKKYADSSVSALDSELRTYISRTVVPQLTATIQINSGQIDDLKNSLAKLSTTYNTNKTEYDAIIDNIYSLIGDSSEENTTYIMNEINNLTEVLENYKSESSADLTDVENEISSLRALLEESIRQLENLTESELADLKSSLIAQINANKSLTDAQKQEMLAAVDSLNAETAANLKDAKEYLMSYTDAVYDSLENAIEDLTISANGDLEQTKEELSAQINSNAALSNAQKQELLEMINDLDEVTASSIDSIQAYLNEQLANQASNMNVAVDDLGNSIDALATRLTLVENSLETLLQNSIDELKTNLEAQIGGIKSSDIWLAGVTIPASEFTADNGYTYTLTNTAFKADSDITITYATTEGFTVRGYTQGEGTLTIQLSGAPLNDIVISGMHVENKVVEE